MSSAAQMLQSTPAIIIMDSHQCPQHFICFIFQIFKTCMDRAHVDLFTKINYNILRENLIISFAHKFHLYELTIAYRNKQVLLKKLGL